MPKSSSRARAGGRVRRVLVEKHTDTGKSAPRSGASLVPMMRRLGKAGLLIMRALAITGIANALAKSAIKMMDDRIQSIRHLIQESTGGPNEATIVFLCVEASGNDAFSLRSVSRNCKRQHSFKFQRDVQLRVHRTSFRRPHP
jgi:hypothetical protein